MLDEDVVVKTPNVFLLGRTLRPLFLMNLEKFWLAAKICSELTTPLGESEFVAGATAVGVGRKVRTANSRSEIAAVTIARNLLTDIVQNLFYAKHSHGEI